MIGTISLATYINVAKFKIIEPLGQICQTRTQVTDNWLRSSSNDWVARKNIQFHSENLFTDTTNWPENLHPNE